MTFEPRVGHDLYLQVPSNVYAPWLHRGTQLPEEHPLARWPKCGRSGAAIVHDDEHRPLTTLGAETPTYDGADRHTKTVKGATTVEYLRDATDRIVQRKVNGVVVARYGFSGAGDTSGMTSDASSVVVEKTLGLIAAAAAVASWPSQVVLAT